ncbi:hypothetical protein ACFQDN_23555 [Pseudomonas asuensis]|jgi:hypothetical protein|uniref:Uncharacterized protein n=1 Tax=Pseudomonas asuensis TaxID=1825787 RepID=A0ABQ2H3T3_9PSED|nr:hypothetical protein GCM10009425_49300 [Pseudomonas asuensis]
MPLSALQHADVDFCLPVNDISAELIELVGQAERKTPHDAPEWVSKESQLAEEEVN